RPHHLVRSDAVRLLPRCDTDGRHAVEHRHHRRAGSWCLEPDADSESCPGRDPPARTVPPAGRKRDQESRGCAGRLSGARGQGAHDAGLPDDCEFRDAIRAYMEWATREVDSYSPAGAQVGAGLPMPMWSWDGLVTAPDEKALSD